MDLSARVVGLAAVSLLVGVTRAAAAPAYVWIEAEDSPSANFKVGTDAAKAEVLSGGRRVFHAVQKQELASVPAEGFKLAYDFMAPADGQYRFWARIGMEWVRARMQWRIDNGPWQTYAETELTTNLMRLAVWTEIAWANCGQVTLTKGKHRLELVFTLPQGKDRLIFGLDCFAFVQGDWIPEGRLKPGETYDGEADKAAAQHVYVFPADGAPGGAALGGAAGAGAAPPAGGRASLALSGPWQAARYDDLNMDENRYEPVRALPAGYPWRWMSVTVPGNAWDGRPELPFAHRLVCQARVRVPAEFAGRSFLLHFAGTCYIASVFVNGEFCGARQSVLVPWDVDITKAVRPGRENLVQVAVKGAYYCLDTRDPKTGERGSIHQRRNLPEGFYRNVKWEDAVYPSSKGEGDGLRVGIVNPCTLVVAGPAYTSDVFIRTSVARRRLDAAVEVSNPSAKPLDVEVRCAAVHDRTGQVEKEFPPAKVTVPAGGTAAAQVAGDWPGAKLWWPSENVQDLPDCYRLRTTLLAGGKALDRREDLFGFREITIRGRDYLLNGVPWRFYNWVDVPDRRSVKEPMDWLRQYHAQNDGFHRFSQDHSSVFGWREKAAEVLDRLGVPCRASTCIDGMFITQDMLNPVLWQNWENHLRQVVRAYRNHPSIVHWSIGNEIMLINAHNTRRREYADLEKKMAALVQLVKELDPTRDAYEDGAGDLGGMGPVDCVHYSWQWYADLPRQLYEYPTGPTFQPRPGERPQTYLWDGNRPIIGGEEFFYANRPFNVSWFGGPDVYRSARESHLAAGRYARMAIEGARWQNAAGMCPWTDVLPGGSQKALARRAVFVREYNQCFAPGAALVRTIKVFNDTRRAEALTLRWRLVLGGQPAAQGEKTYQLAAGMNQEDKITAALPRATARLDGELVLELFSGGNRVFEDARPVSVLPLAAGPPAVAAGQLAVFDPQGGVAKWLAARKVPFTLVSGPDALPPAAPVILVGPKALAAENLEAWAAALRDAVLAGKTAIVLEQDNPLQQSDLPAAGIAVAMEKKQKVTWGEFARQGGRFGSICHPVALVHPVFRGLRPSDFLTWAGGETNYRLSYEAPAGGALALVQAGPELTLAPMMELPVGAGSYLLSQVLVGGKLVSEPVAGVLLDNILSWAAERAGRRPNPAIVYAGGDAAWQAWLEGLGLDCRAVPTAAEALAGGAHVAVIRADAAAAAYLRDNAAAVRGFCEKGGWVMLCGLTPEWLEALDALTGLAHRVRPFRVEGVRLLEARDPAVMGVTDRDLNQRGYEMIAPWMNLYRASDQVFTQVVDAAPNIASFAKGGGKMADGLFNSDFWWYVQYLPPDGSAEFEFDRLETLSAVHLWTSAAYYRPKDVAVILDGDEAGAVRKTLDAGDDRQEMTIVPPRAVRRVSIRILSVQGESRKDLATIDEVALIRQLPAAAEGRVVALTSPAGLVRYPVGQGGILLNQLQWRESPPPTLPRGVDARRAADIAADNTRKKQAIMVSLLRNLGAAFRPMIAAAPPAAQTSPGKAGPPKKPPAAPKKK